jgi:hypothetical protein
MMSLDSLPSRARRNKCSFGKNSKEVMMKSLRRVLLLLAAMVALSGAPSAWSQDVLDDTLVTETPSDDGVPADEAYHPPKSRAAAFGWMVAGTVGPVAAALMLPESEAAFFLGAGGVVIGPSVGQFYAGSLGTGFQGIGIRLLGLPVGLVLGGLMASGASDEGFAALAAFLGGMMIGGGVMWIAGTTYSLIDTPRAVDRANERARRALFSNVSLSPMFYPTRDERNVMRWAPGLAFNASF